MGSFDFAMDMYCVCVPYDGQTASSRVHTYRMYWSTMIPLFSLRSLLQNLFQERQNPLPALVSFRQGDSRKTYDQRHEAWFAVLPGTASPHPLPFLLIAKCNSCFCSSAVHTPFGPFLLTFILLFPDEPVSLQLESLLGGEDEGYGRDSTLAVGLGGVRGILLIAELELSLQAVGGGSL